MADHRRGVINELKRDQTIRRDIREEIGLELVQDHSGASYRNPNRDQVRGDSDRSHRRTDEYRTRDSQNDVTPDIDGR